MPVLFPDNLNDLVLDGQWTDNQIQFDHRHYQQEYGGIPVEGCEFTEHGENGDAVYAHGKICPEIGTIYKEGWITQQQAMSTISSEYNEVIFAWQDTIMEEELQTDLNDVMPRTFHRVN